MRKFLFAFTVFVLLVGGLYFGLTIYGSYLDRELRSNISRVHPGMDEHEVIRILGEPTHRKISDIPGTYWSYDTDVVGRLLSDNPDRMGHLVLEMGADGKVVKVFDLK